MLPSLGGPYENSSGYLILCTLWITVHCGVHKKDVMIIDMK